MYPSLCDVTCCNRQVWTYLSVCASLLSCTNHLLTNYAHCDYFISFSWWWKCVCVTGNNTLLRMLYEVDGNAAVEGARLLDVPSLWRYRARVTLEHLKREVEEQHSTKQKTSPYPVLDLFLREVVLVTLIILCCKKFCSWQFVIVLRWENQFTFTNSWGVSSSTMVTLVIGNFDLWSVAIFLQHRVDRVSLSMGVCAD